MVSTCLSPAYHFLNILVVTYKVSDVLQHNRRLRYLLLRQSPASNTFKKGRVRDPLVAWAQAAT